MAIYKGTISGIGDKATRENEITADALATLRHFIDNNNLGVINFKYSETDDLEDIINSFDAKVSEDENNSIDLSSGLCVAYGYFGYADKQKITFLLPAVPQYQLIYAEFDKSVIPNKFTIKTKNNMANPYISVTTFRQDQLSTIKTGICQIPLWQVYITSSGIQKEKLRDLRIKLPYIKNVVNSETCKHLNENSSIESSVTGVTQPTTDDSNKIATTLFAHNAISSVINK